MPLPIGLQADVPCFRCHERIAGLAWGERCPACQGERRVRARRLARRVSLLAALIAAGGLGWGMTPGPSARTTIGIGTLLTFMLVRAIAMRMAMEFLPD